MTQANEPNNRLDRLENLAEAILLAIRELSNRQETSQNQLDQLQERFEDVANQQSANAHQIAANSEQIAANTAGLIELRNLFADFLRSQRRDQ